MAHIIDDEVEALKVVLDRQGYDYGAGDLDFSELEALEEEYNLPQSYIRFFKGLEPSGNEIRYGQRHSVIFYSLEDLREAQSEEHWVYGGFVIGSLNEQPLVLGLEEMDENGECPIFRSEDFEAKQLASTFLQYIQMLRASLEMLYSLEEYDDTLRWSEENEESEQYMNEFDEYSDPAASRDELLESYYQEIEDIDPDCADAWEIDHVDQEEVTV